MSADLDHMREPPSLLGVAPSLDALVELFACLDTEAAFRALRPRLLRALLRPRGGGAVVLMMTNIAIAGEERTVLSGPSTSESVSSSPVLASDVVDLGYGVRIRIDDDDTAPTDEYSDDFDVVDLDEEQTDVVDTDDDEREDEDEVPELDFASVAQDVGSARERLLLANLSRRRHARRRLSSGHDPRSASGSSSPLQATFAPPGVLSAPGPFSDFGQRRRTGRGCGACAAFPCAAQTQAGAPVERAESLPRVRLPNLFQRGRARLRALHRSFRPLQPRGVEAKGCTHGGR